MSAHLGCENSQNVEINIIFFQKLYALNYAVVRALSLVIDPVAVVYFTCSVKGDANEEFMIREEFAPFVVK